MRGAILYVRSVVVCVVFVVEFAISVLYRNTRCDFRIYVRRIMISISYVTSRTG